jgi:hypothetical protein
MLGGRFPPDNQRDFICNGHFKGKCAYSGMAVPAGVTYCFHRPAGATVDETAVWCEHDVVDVEFFKAVLQIVPACFAVPIVVMGYAKGLHAKFINNNVHLPCGVLASGDGKNAVIIVTGIGFGLPDYFIECLPADRPVDVDFLLRRYAGLALSHFVELDAFTRLGHNTAGTIFKVWKHLQ